MVPGNVVEREVGMIERSEELSSATVGLSLPDGPSWDVPDYPLGLFLLRDGAIRFQVVNMPTEKTFIRETH